MSRFGYWITMTAIWFACDMAWPLIFGHANSSWVGWSAGFGVACLMIPRSEKHGEVSNHD